MFPDHAVLVAIPVVRTSLILIPGNPVIIVLIHGGITGEFIVFFIVVSAAIAIVQVKSSVTFIAQLMGISWGALAGAFLAPYLCSLYSKKITKVSVWVSFICGVGIMAANMICTFAGVPFINAFFSSPINAGVLAMLSGLIIVPAVSMITPKPDKAQMDEMFSCYDRTITVRASTALEEDHK